MTVRAHVTSGELVNTALDAGVDSLEHTPRFPSVDLESATQFANLFDLQSVEAKAMVTTLRRMANDDAVLVPTLVAMNKLVPWTRVRLGQTVSVYEEVVGFYTANGGAVALGTDYPQDTRVGMPIEEIQALSRSGMSNIQIVAAATYNAAWACGQQADLGSLEVGKLGDIIIVNGDPLTNIGSLADVTAVVLGGEVVVAP
jgi:imidazolonepropionase-like amidohydrolase